MRYRVTTKRGEMMTNEFLFTSDYNTEMHRHIDDLFTTAKLLDTSRQDRLQSSDALVEAYVIHTDKRPDGTALGRLATLILRDELTDPTPYKTQNTEYPFESEHKKKRHNDGITSASFADSVGTDGRDYRTPHRRKRSPSENAYMDRNAGRSRDVNGKKTK